MRDSSTSGAHLLEVANLAVTFQTRRGLLKAVDGISFHIGHGEIVGLVGESGSGKSVTAMALARLLPEPPATVTADRMALNGVDLLGLSPDSMRSIRGRNIGFVFQNPLSSLNPVMPVGAQIAEVAQVHLKLSRREAWNRAALLLGQVGIPQAATRLRDYPHQFSGGMRQRVMVAIALARRPQLILADEPTTALDVTIQAQLLELLRSIVAESGASVLLITHDLGIAAGLCDRVYVMYAGEIAETASADELFDDPLTPYTRGLLGSIPRLDRRRDQPLDAIPGNLPDPIARPSGCRFAPRCRHARPACLETDPPLTARASPTHLARCLATDTGGWLS